MKTFITASPAFQLLFSVCFAAFFLCGAVFGQTTAFTYQGRFTDSSVPQPTNGNYNMKFRLFDAASGGNQIPNNTTEINSLVSVSNNIFTVRLDFGVGAFNTNGERYLEIQVGTTILAPRQEITAAPFSLRARNAAAADSLSSACVGCVTSDQIGSVDGSKVTGTVANAATAITAENVTGVVPISSGGTGSSTQNFLDLTTNQTAAGVKTFSGANTFFGGTIGVAGRLGVGINTPLLDFHIRNGNTPAIRLEQTNQGGFTAQTWDIGANEANFFVRDLTGGSRLPFRIRPGAPTSSIDISANGNVGVGTPSPKAKLDVRDGDIYVFTSNQGLILKSPDGTICRRLTIDNAGAITLTSLTCP